MSKLHGKYFDGAQSRGKAASLRWSAVSATVEVDGGVRIGINPAKLKVSSPLPGTPTRITFGEKESFVTSDNAGIENLRNAFALEPGLASRVEQHMPTVLAAAVVVIALLAGLGIWGVPALASRLALTVPENISEQMSALLLTQFDRLLSPSEIETGRRQELTTYFNSHGEIPRLEFRDARALGANALTLGTTMITFTDDLVELADSDDELLAVYFHELGHARLRHVEQRVFRASAWLVLLTLLTGDAGAVGELLVSLPVAAGLAAYSREFEREADAFAVDRLLEADISPEVFASILEKLEFHHTIRISGSDLEDEELYVFLDYLSSHPPTSERIAYIRSRIAED